CKYGFKANKSKNIITPNTEVNHNPFTNTRLPLSILPSASELATSGVIADENPTKTDIPMNTKLLAKDAAANLVAPILPTIILSITPTKVCPSIDNIIGYANLML